MNHKTASICLITGVFGMTFLTVLRAFSWNSFMSWQPIFDTVLSLATALLTLVVLFQYMSRASFDRSGILLKVLGGFALLHFGFLLYSVSEDKNILSFRRPDLLIDFLVQVINYIGFIVFCWFASRGQIKRASVFLFISAMAGICQAIISLPRNISWMIWSFGWGEVAVVSVLILFLVIMVLYPAASASFALHLEHSQSGNTNENEVLRGQDDLLDSNLDDRKEAESGLIHLSFMHWIYFLTFSIIPAAGLIMNIIWIAKKGNSQRTNWAFARGITGIVTSAAWLFYLTRDERDKTPLYVMLAILFVLLIVMIALWQVRTNRLAKDDWEADTVQRWLGRHFLILLPIVGLIMLIIWVSSKEDKVRQRWAGGQLIASGVWVLVYIYFLNLRWF